MCDEMSCAFKVKLNSQMTFLFRMAGRLLLKLSIQNRLGKWRGTEREKYKENNHYLAKLGLY